MKLKISALLIATTLTFSASAIAETLVEKIKKRAAEASEIRALLNDPDQNTRIAALDVMLKSTDTAMRELAYTTGFNSADDTLRAITLRNKFNELNTLTLYFTLPEDADEKIKSQFDYFGGSLSLLFDSYDENTGKFKAASSKSSSYPKPGSVSGLSVNFNTRYCGGTLVLNEESELAGEVTCEKFKFFAKASII